MDEGAGTICTCNPNYNEFCSLCGLDNEESGE